MKLARIQLNNLQKEATVKMVDIESVGKIQIDYLKQLTEEQQTMIKALRNPEDEVM